MCDVGCCGGGGVLCVVGCVGSAEGDTGCRNSFPCANVLVVEGGCAADSENVARYSIVCIRDGCSCGGVVGFVAGGDGDGQGAGRNVRSRRGGCVWRVVGRIGSGEGDTGRGHCFPGSDGL